MKYTYIPKGTERELVRSGMNCYRKGSQIVGIVRGRMVVSHHSKGHLEGITLGAGKEADEVAGGASGMADGDGYTQCGW